MPMRRNWLALAAILGFISVAGGAFGAHAAPDERTRELLKTAALYGFIHALAVFAWAALTPVGSQGRLTPMFFLGGALVFCGSLYALAMGAPGVLGAVTPAGGLMFMAGWLSLAWTMRKR